MRVLRELYFTKNFAIELNVEKEIALRKLDSFLKKDSNTFGKVRYNEFAFMHKNTMPKVNKYSLVCFNGHAISENNKTILDIKARLTEPFCYIYLLAALIIPIMYIFNSTLTS
jgi:hypothetical protein